MASLAARGLDSFYSLNGADRVVQHWLAVGGMLAASTPIISLFLVTGSVYAMSGISSKLVGAEHIDEKIATPDALSPGPMMNMAPMRQYDSFSGGIRAGAEGAAGDGEL